MVNKKITAILLIFSLSNLSCLSTFKNKDKVCFDGQCVKVEIVQTQKERERGLQNRGSLDKDAGMLFIFAKSGKHGFWMKNTLISLDMIWLNNYQEIVYIQENAVPCRMPPCKIYSPDRDALYVLEVNAGYAEEQGLKVGDRADFKIKFKQEEQREL